MLTAREFVARWGHAEAFVSYDLDVVRSLSVSEETKAFLIDPGMPCVEKTFVIKDNRLPTLEEAFGAHYAREGRGLDTECRNMRVLGTHGDSMPAALLDEGQNGTIAQLGFDPAGNLYPIFCNSTLRQFAEYTLIFKEFLAWMQQQEEFPEWVRGQQEGFESETAYAFVTKVEEYGRSLAVKLREVDAAVSEAVDRFRANSEDYDRTGREPCYWSTRISALEEGWLTNDY